MEATAASVLHNERGMMPEPLEPGKNCAVPSLETEDFPERHKEVVQEGSAEGGKPQNWGDDAEGLLPSFSLSFTEESTKVGDLLDEEKKALEDLKLLVREAMDKHQLSASVANEKQQETKQGGSGTREEHEVGKPVEVVKEAIVSVSSPLLSPYQDKATDPPEEEEVAGRAISHKKSPEEVSIWGVPLLLDERTDVILLKFLRAREFNVSDSLAMIKDTIRWRKEFGIEELVDEDLGCGNDFEKVVFMHGHDKEGHPVCYNVFGQFQDKELYRKVLSDEEKRRRFLRWRIQFLERSIRKLDFSPGGVSTILQVNDLKHSPGLGKKELRQATREALQVLQDNYPEFLAKQVFINVPWWYLAFCKMISPFLTQRTKSKFVFAGPSKSVETLSRFISAEQIPVKYGGLGKDGDFGEEDGVNEISMKAVSKHTIEFPIPQGAVVIWEIRVVGWEVKYGAEFAPSAADSYTVIIQKCRKVAADDDPVICDSFKAGEGGKLVLTIDNPTTRKKKLLYRFKIKSTVY